MDYRRNWLKHNPENVPVASRLLPQEAHAPLGAFYAFMRCADEMAGNVKLPPERRHKQLLDLEEALKFGDTEKLPESIHDFAALARSHPPLMSYARDLLSASVQDTLKPRYRDYIDLVDYYHRAAIPVGRAVLYVCAEQHADSEAVDALSAVLQLLSHIRECSDDYVNRGRVYLPLDWFTVARAEVTMLADSECAPALRGVLDRGLEKCDALLRKAQSLPLSIDTYRMRLLAAWLYLMARALHARLKRRDPLAGYVHVGRLSAAWAFLLAAVLAI